MRHITLITLACFSFALAGCDIEDFDGGGDHSQADFHYNYPLQPGGTVNIDTFNGGIEIVGWDQNAVDIAGTKYARTPELRDAIKVDTTHSDSTVSIHVVRPFDNHGNMGARFVIHVPKKVNLDRVVSSNGKIDVRGVTGTANLRTSNGHIEAEQVDGPLDVSTSNGHITIQEELSSGRSPIHARTSNGPIEITARHPILSDLHASTSNGSITVHLPEATSARVRASTSNSGITSEFEVTTQGRMDKHHLEGTISGSRSDAPIIDLSTSNGHIRLAKL
jgi:Putative adhesin